MVRPVDTTASTADRLSPGEIELLERRVVEEETIARKYAHQEATISIPTFQMRAILAHLKTDQRT